jgi:hypothetical protein
MPSTLNDRESNIFRSRCVGDQVGFQVIRMILYALPTLLVLPQDSMAPQRGFPSALQHLERPGRLLGIANINTEYQIMF